MQHHITLVAMRFDDRVAASGSLYSLWQHRCSSERVVGCCSVCDTGELKLILHMLNSATSYLNTSSLGFIYDIILKPAQYTVHIISYNLLLLDDDMTCSSPYIILIWEQWETSQGGTMGRCPIVPLVSHCSPYDVKWTLYIQYKWSHCIFISIFTGHHATIPQTEDW